MAVAKFHPFPFFSPQSLLPRQKILLPQQCFFPSKPSQPFQLKAWLSIPVLPSKHATRGKTNIDTYDPFPEFIDSLPVTFPSLAFSNTLFFSSTYTVQVIPGDNEPEDKLISRFRKEVLRARVLQECKRRRFFETTQEKKKRKTREAQRKYRKRRPPPKVTKNVKAESTKKKKYESDDDNWEIPDADEDGRMHPVGWSYPNK